MCITSIRENTLTSARWEYSFQFDGPSSTSKQLGNSE